jgi:hypothetical protein
MSWVENSATRLPVNTCSVGSPFFEFRLAPVYLGIWGPVSVGRGAPAIVHRGEKSRRHLARLVREDGRAPLIQSGTTHIRVTNVPFQRFDPDRGFWIQGIEQFRAREGFLAVDL